MSAKGKTPSYLEERMDRVHPEGNAKQQHPVVDGRLGRLWVWLESRTRRFRYRFAAWLER